MPFTVSHVVAVLPFFRWKRLDRPTLVIGSMVPDAGYFVHRFDLAAEAHTLEGTLLQALPLGCILWAIGRCLAEFLTGPLPDPHRGAARDFLLGSPGTLFSPFWIVFSLLLGIWSHTFLDSFTHLGGWSVRHLPFLQSPWPVYKVLQHMGSLVGVLILLEFYRRWRRVSGANRTRWTWKHGVLAGSVVLAGLAAFPSAWSFASGLGDGFAIEALIVRWLLNAIAFFVVAYLFVTVVVGICRVAGDHADRQT